MIRDSVTSSNQGREVVFDAEHFDGYKANPAYALACVRAAKQAGADSLDLCETNGGALPHRVGRDRGRRHAYELPGQRIGIHCHNDSGCAVAGVLAAVRGATRCRAPSQLRRTRGQLRPAHHDRRPGAEDGLHHRGSDKLRQLTSVSQFVAETCNMWPVPAATIPTRARRRSRTGRPARQRHRALRGVRARAPRAWERHAHAGERAGWRASLVAKAASLGVDLAGHPEQAQAILDDIKAREAQGYSYEVADGSLAVLLQWHLGTYRPHFTLESFRVIVDDHEDTGARAKDAMSEATIKIHVGDERFVATGEGAGPVGALDNALRLAITQFFPEVAGMELVDYKVRILDENVGTGAITRVVITTRDADGTWGTIGVSENIIEASWNALVDSIE